MSFRSPKYAHTYTACHSRGVTENMIHENAGKENASHEKARHENAGKENSE